MPAIHTPGIGKIHFPDGMALQEIQAAVQKLSGNVGRDPSTGQRDFGLERLDVLMAGAPDTPREPKYRVTLPGAGGAGFTLRGAPASFANAMNNIPVETSAPIVGATLASIAFPPAAPAIASRMPMWSALASRFGPSILAAGTGGGMGGALAESANPESTPGSVARAGLRSGAEMALAETAGLGIAGLANRALAPNLRFLDPLKPVRQRVAQFAREAPQHTRGVLSKFVEALPAGARSAAEGVRAASTQVSNVFRGLVAPQATTATVSTRAVANRVAETLHQTIGKRPMRIIDRVSGNPQMLETLRRSLSPREFDDFLSVTLSRAIERSTVTQGGRRILDGQKLLTLWRQFPSETQQAFSGATRSAIESLAVLGTTIQRAGKFASSSIGAELVEAAVVPAATAVFGLPVGVPLYIAKALMSPGPLVRYLTRSNLPSEAVRTLGRQTLTTGIRSGLLDEEPQQ